jgi:hypothetical protein
MSAWTPTERLAELVGASSTLPPDSVRLVLAEIWPGLHAPLRHHSTAALVAMFRHAGYVSDSAPMPGTDLVIYRGEPADPPTPGLLTGRSPSTTRAATARPVRHESCKRPRRRPRYSRGSLANPRSSYNQTCSRPSPASGASRTSLSRTSRQRCISGHPANQSRRANAQARPMTELIGDCSFDDVSLPRIEHLDPCLAND